MLQPSKNNIKNTVYFSSKQEKGGKQDKEEAGSFSDEELEKMLEVIGRKSIKERSPDINELEKILQAFLNNLREQDSTDTESTKQETKEDREEITGDSTPITTFLKEQGYLRDSTKRWLTRKGFMEVGNKILKDVMRDLSSSDFGLHETVHAGHGNVIVDTTKKFEVGDDIKLVSVPQTLLNTISRVSKDGKKVSFPLQMDLEDFEKYETLEDVKAAVVYCIDLSSTMRYSLGTNGKSRIEAAKRALWSLYILNKKFFPTDIVHVIGFASMASEVDPYDIPFLKTFDANDNFLHYTNYQAAFSLARKLLQKTPAHNKRIIMITDGQPSACFVENLHQKNEIISDKPYSNFYSPEEDVLLKMKNERNLNLNSAPGRLVYLCFRYKKVDPKIDKRTIIEAKKCLRAGIHIDSIVISDEDELLDYIKEFEKELHGKTYHIENENMDKVLVIDYIRNTKKVLKSSTLGGGW